MLAAGGYQHIRMFDLTSGDLNPVVNYGGISKNVMTVGFQEDGRWMYSGGEDCSARIWDLKMRNLACQRIYQVRLCNEMENKTLFFSFSRPTNPSTACVCTPTSRSSSSATRPASSTSGTCRTTSPSSSSQRLTSPSSRYQWIPRVSTSLPSTTRCGLWYIFVKSNQSYFFWLQGNCYVWSLTEGGPKQSSQLHPKNKILAHKRYGLCCKFSPDSSHLVTSAADTTIKVWRTSDFSLVTELRCETQRGWVWDLDFTADSQYVVSASSDSVARLWSLRTGDMKREYTAHQKPLTSLAFRDLNTAQTAAGAS